MVTLVKLSMYMPFDVPICHFFRLWGISVVSIDDGKLSDILCQCAIGK